MHCQLEREIIEIQKEAITYRSYICIYINSGNDLYYPDYAAGCSAGILSTMVRVLH